MTAIEYADAWDVITRDIREALRSLEDQEPALRDVSATSNGDALNSLQAYEHARPGTAVRVLIIAESFREQRMREIGLQRQISHLRRRMFTQRMALLLATVLVTLVTFLVGFTIPALLALAGGIGVTLLPPSGTQPAFPNPQPHRSLQAGPGQLAIPPREPTSRRSNLDARRRRARRKAWMVVGGAPLLTAGLAALGFCAVRRHRARRRMQ